MQKLINWCKGHSLKLATLLLLAFIPLYPKLPLLDIKHTWVYIRVEDFLVLFVLLWWSALFVRQKVTLKNPLTVPIFLFWIIGAIATIHAILIIFPTLSGVYANVSFLSFIRRIEYMSVFFSRVLCHERKKPNHSGHCDRRHNDPSCESLWARSKVYGVAGLLNDE